MNDATPTTAPAADVGAPQPDPLADARLMRAIAAGDRAALGHLYDRYADRLLGLLVRVLGDRHDAEETLVELFWEVWDRADRYDVNRGCVATYLMTLARSRAIDRRRRRAARPDADPARARPVDAADHQLAAGGGPGADPAPLAGVLHDEQARAVRVALDRLDPTQRQVIELSFFDGLSHSEIADRLRRPLGTVKTWIRQGLGRLRESLRGYQG